MVTVDEAVIAKLSTHGEDFEVLVDPELVLEYRAGEDIDLREILASEKIFKDSSKGKKASEERMEELFGTSDPIKVADKIINKGKIQVTTEQRQHMRDQRRKQVIALISRRSIDPQSDRPHPPNRIENAMDKAGVQIDPFKSAEEQLSEIVEALRPSIPLRFETKRIAIKIPPKYAGKAYRIVDEAADIKKDEWLDDGSWAVVVEIPAGIQSEFFEKINNFTQGEVEIKVI